MAKDPTVNVNIIDESVQASTANLNLGLKILVPVYSNSGSTDVQYISSQSDFLKEYTSDERLTTQDHESLFYAYRLLQYGSIYVKRIGTNYLFPAMTSLGEEILINKEGKVQNTQKLTIEEKPLNPANYWVATATTVYYVGSDEGLPAGLVKVSLGTVADVDVLVNNLIYAMSPGVISHTGSTIESLIKITEISDSLAFMDSTSATGKYKYITALIPDLVSGDYLSFGGYDYFLQSSSQFVPPGLSNPIPIRDGRYSASMEPTIFMQRILSKEKGGISALIAVKYLLTGADDLQVFAQGCSGTGTQIIFKYNHSEKDPYIVYNNTAYYCGPIAPELGTTKVQLTPNSDLSTNDFLLLIWDYSKNNTDFGMSIDPTSQMIFLVYSGIGVSTNKPLSISITKNPDLLTYQYTFPTQENNARSLLYQNLYLQINNNVYFIGDTPSNPPEGSILISLGNLEMKISDFIQKVTSQALMNFRCSLVSGVLNFLDPVTSAFVSTELITTITSVQFSTTAKFAIAQNFSSSQDLLRFDYTKLQNDQYNLDVTYRGVTLNYLIGFDPSMIDDYGQSIFYSNDRFQNKYYKILEITDTGATEIDQFSSGLFGGSVGQALPSPANIRSCIEDVFYKEENLYWDMITDGGVSDISLAQSISSLATKFRFQYSPSIPVDYKLQDIVGYIQGLGLDNFWCYYIAAGHRATVAGMSKSFPGSILGIIKFIQNNNNPTFKFVSPFGKTYGSVPLTDPQQFFTDDERKQLLNLNVNVVKRDADSGYYLATAYTAQKANSQLSFIQNVRMSGLMCKISDIYLEGYLAESNTDALRLNVTDTLTSILSQNFYGGWKNQPNSIEVICNDSNNPTEIQSQNILVVDVNVVFPGTIVTINIYNRIKPLS